MTTTQEKSKIRLARAEGEDLVVQARTEGEKFLTEIGFSETAVIVQPGRSACLHCVHADVRKRYKIGFEQMTKVLTDGARIFFETRGIRIPLNDLPVGQYVEILPEVLVRVPVTNIPVIHDFVMAGVAV